LPSENDAETDLANARGRRVFRGGDRAGFLAGEMVDECALFDPAATVDVGLSVLAYPPVGIIVKRQEAPCR